jgi:hypothetical protein
MKKYLPVSRHLANKKEVHKEVATPDDQSDHMHVPDSCVAALIVKEVLSFTARKFD